MPILFSLIFGSTALVVIAAPTQQRGKQQSPQAIDWNATAADHQRQIDQDFSYRCLSDGRVGTAWGTDTYTNDSSICTAAVHAGLITARDGGVVTIKIRPGASSYIGTTRNGVTTTGYGSYTGSFIFINRVTSSPVSDLSVQTINWNTTAADHAGQIDQDFSYRCLSDGRVGTVWGTDTYTNDSSICTAAVHAGLITARDGGVVTIKVRPGASSYIGTTRNGVTTTGYGSYTGSFTFVNSSR
ncbi:MAG: LCCL domain-containing protein [Nostoc sp.]